MHHKASAWHSASPQYGYLAKPQVPDNEHPCDAMHCSKCFKYSRPREVKGFVQGHTAGNDGTRLKLRKSSIEFVILNTTFSCYLWHIYTLLYAVAIWNTSWRSLFFVFFFFFFGDRISLASPDWYWTCDSPDLISWMLGLQVCPTMAGLCILIVQENY
jgi:hypothetical protein